MVQQIYLDVTGDVIGRSVHARTLEEAQAKNPSITTVIANAPDAVVVKGVLGVVIYHQKTSGDGTDISHYTEIPYLDVYKKQKIQEIAVRTTELLDMGFTYDDHTFDMSSSFAAMYSILMLLDRSSSVTFPVPLQDFEGAPYPIDDRATLKALLASAVAATMDLQEADVQLCNTILAATSQAEIDAVTDSREPITIPTEDIVAVEDFTSSTIYEDSDSKETSTTATSPKERFTLKAPGVVETGSWCLEWSLEYKSARSSSKAYTSISIGETQIATDHIKGDDWKHAFGSSSVTLDAGDHEVTVAYWSNSKRYAATIRNISLRLTRRNEV